MNLAAVLEWLWSVPRPPEVDAKARLVLLDTVGCAIAGFSHAKVSLLGKTSPAGFAAAACWDEACEGLARAHGRPAVAVIAALQQLARERGSTFGEVLDALVAGYEAGGRLGEALRIGPGMHVDATWPSLGVAVSVVRLLQGTAVQALNAVRIAACQIPRSLYLPVKTGAEARNTYLGHAAQLGILSAQAALAGFTAPENVLEELGAKPLAASGQWLILEGYLKQFAAVRHVHYGAKAGLLLKDRIQAESVKNINLRIYGEAITYCGNRAPRTAIQAQFSLSYGLAHALLFGSLDPDAYRAERLKDARLAALEKKVSIEEDPALTAAGKRAATLVIDGHETTVDSLPEMTRGEVLAKFARYAGRDGAGLLDADPAARFSIPA